MATYVRRALALAVAGALVCAAPAAAKQSIAALPHPLKIDQTLAVTGKGWPVIEFCSRTVRLSLRSDQNAFRIGLVRVTDRGRFRFEWIPRRAKVGPGRWQLVARMRCESGKDGSVVWTRASVTLRIRA